MTTMEIIVTTMEISDDDGDYVTTMEIIVTTMEIIVTTMEIIVTT